jgi:hypothetical protein
MTMPATILLTRHRKVVQLTLSFSIVRCACGAERQAEQSCVACGCAPDEVDSDLERRRTIVEALDLARLGPPELEPVWLDGLWAELSDWLSRFLAAYERADEGTAEEAAARIQLEVDALAVLGARIAATRRLRPHVAGWAAVDRVVAMQVRLVELYTRALVAPTPEQARALAEEAQTVLDNAVVIIGRYNAVVDGWSTVHEVPLDDEFGDIVAGASAAFSLSGATSLVDFEAKGADLFQRITGESGCPVGFGVRLHLVNLFVESSLDEARFWAAARTVYESVVASRDAFGLLARDESWRRDFVAMARETREAGLEAAAIGEAPANRRRDLRSGIRLGAVITERLAPCLLGTLLAVKRRTPYEREVAKDIATQLKEVRAAGLTELVIGIDLALRDADAHAAFKIVDEGVRFSGTRREYGYLSDEELVDRVLMGFESIFALNIGITAALSAVGVEHEELEALIEEEPQSEELVRTVMAMNGWSNVEVLRGGGTLYVRGEREVETVSGVAASLLAAIEDDVLYLVFEGSGIGKRRIAKGPVEPYRRGAESSDPAEKHAAALEALATWTIDGKSPIAASALRKLIALSALGALDPTKPHNEAMAELRAMADLAKRLTERGLFRDRRDRAVSARVEDALTLRRKSESEGVSHDELQPVVDALLRLAPENVPPIRSSW